MPPLAFLRGELGGVGRLGDLLGGGIVRQPLEDFGRVVLGIEPLGVAVGE